MILHKVPWGRPIGLLKTLVWITRKNLVDKSGLIHMLSITYIIKMGCERSENLSTALLVTISDRAGVPSSAGFLAGPHEAGFQWG